nr:S41 family peptidase [Gemmatimonadaceae bacterium]
MKREKMAWMVSIALVAILAFQLPGTLAQRDDDYSFVRTLIDIHRQVVSNYADSVDEAKLREGAIDGMLGQLDPFTVYVPPARQEMFDQMLEGSFKGVGIQLDQRPDGGPIEVITPIDGSPAFRSGVLPGDVILKVNGDSIEGLRLPEVVKRIAGKLGSEVTLTVRHATGEEADLKMERAEIVVPTIKGYQRNSDHTWDYYLSDDPKVAYIRVTQFTGETYEAMRTAIEKQLSDGMKGLILDLRYNPGGQLESAVKVVDMFLDSGVIVSTKGRNRPEQIIKANAPQTLPYFPTVVLVNEHSASAAEIVAGSLMDNKRALVVGERSYGKGSVQELIPLDQKGGELKLTVAYYYLPSGRLVHRKKDASDWGVMPQVPVELNEEQEK